LARRCSCPTRADHDVRCSIPTRRSSDLERLCDTVSYELTQGDISEQALYDQTTAYIRHYYNQARLLNRQAARFAMTVFQRRLARSEEHTSELQSRENLVCRLLLEKKKKN